MVVGVGSVCFRIISYTLRFKRNDFVVVSLLCLVRRDA